MNFCPFPPHCRVFWRLFEVLIAFTGAAFRMFSQMPEDTAWLQSLNLYIDAANNPDVYSRGRVRGWSQPTVFSLCEFGAL